MKRTTDVFISPETVGQSEFFEGRYEPDPRVISIMQKAEDDYYKEKQRLRDLESYHARKQLFEEIEDRNRRIQEQQLQDLKRSEAFRAQEKAKEEALEAERNTF